MKNETAIIEVRLLTIKEAAARLHCAPATIYEQIRTGELVVTRIGRQKGYRIDVRDLDAFVSSRKFYCEPRLALKSRPKLKHLQI